MNISMLMTCRVSAYMWSALCGGKYKNARRSFRYSQISGVSAHHRTRKTETHPLLTNATCSLDVRALRSTSTLSSAWWRCARWRHCILATYIHAKREKERKRHSAQGRPHPPTNRSTTSHPITCNFFPGQTPICIKDTVCKRRKLMCMDRRCPVRPTV